MVSTNQYGEADPDRATYPELEARIGEDPARYLDRDDLELAFARIRGIDFLDVLGEWLRVEVDLNRGPRKDVVAALNQQKAELEDSLEAGLEPRYEHGPYELRESTTDREADDEQLTADEQLRRRVDE